MESQIKNRPKFRPNSDLRLMDQVREVLRYQHYAYRTEQTRCQWKFAIFIILLSKTAWHQGCGAKFAYPATEGKVPASTQRQALNALVFLYRDVLISHWTGSLPLFAASVIAELYFCHVRRHPEGPRLFGRSGVPGCFASRHPSSLSG